MKLRIAMAMTRAIMCLVVIHRWYVDHQIGVENILAVMCFLVVLTFLATV